MSCADGLDSDYMSVSKSPPVRGNCVSRVSKSKLLLKEAAPNRLNESGTEYWSVKVSGPMRLILESASDRPL